MAASNLNKKIIDLAVKFCQIQTLQHIQSLCRKQKVLEIESRCQFHQHFMSSFCAKILLPRNYKPKL